MAGRFAMDVQRETDLRRWSCGRVTRDDITFEAQVNIE